MSFRLPSHTNPAPAFVTTDDALIQPPELADKATDEQRAEWEKALEEYAAKLRVARQTGDWSGITLPGKQPVRFILRPMPFEGHATIAGMRQRGEPPESVLLLAVQLCLVDIEGIAVRVDWEQHERFGKVAALSTLAKFGTSQGLLIAVELGTVAIQRASADPS